VHPAFVAEAAYTAARLAYRQGNLLPARARAEEALRLFEQLGDDRGIALAMAALGTLLLAQDYISEDDRATGEELLSAALDRMRFLNDLHHVAMIANNLGLAKMYGGDLESALELLRESASIDRAIGDKLTLALKVANTVEVLVKLGRVEEALPILQEVAEVQYQSQHRANVGHLLNSIAFALGAKGEGTLAIRLYAAAELELRLTGSAPFSSELESFRTDIGRLRDELESAAFETEWAAGRSLSYEAAMEEARVALDAWEAETTSRSGSIGSTGSARRPH
jgi:tetratricopeptide (TPR) repeat protein